MKILKLLNKKYFSIIFVLLIGFNSHSEDQPVDIWEINKKQIEEENQIKNLDIKEKKDLEQKSISSIYEMQSQKENGSIKLDSNLDSQSIKIIGLYDPEDYGLDIDMWSNSNGDQLKNIFVKLNNLNLSNDANEI